MQNQQQEMDLSPEELAMRKEEMLKFYTESLPYLEAQFKYEEMLMKLDEVRFKRTSIQMQFAMMVQGPGSEEDENEVPDQNTGEEFRTVIKDTEESGKRKLKKS